MAFQGETSESEDETEQCAEEMEDLVKEFSHNESENVCYTIIHGRQFWTPKCDDKLKPTVNKYFSEVEDAFLFYIEYGRICGFDVRKSTTKSKRGNILSKYFQCSRGGKPKEKNPDDANSGKRKRRTTSRKCGCKAQLVLKPAGPRGYVIMSLVEEHNHALATGPEKMFLRCNRKVSLVHEDFIMDCAKAKIGATRSHTLAKEMAGSYDNVGATAQDFRNYKRNIKARIGDHDADMLLDKFKTRKQMSNNTFSYDYKVDENGHLTGIFWADAIGKRNYDVFGDIVSFDPTFRTNRYNMVFIPFTGVDNHWKNVTFAAALLEKEDYDNFKWLLLTFEKAMGGVPPCVITDQCPAINKAIFENWKTTKHRFCMWHIMNKLPENWKTTKHRFCMCAKLDRMKMKRTNAWFYFQKSIDYAGEDEEKLDTVVSDLEGISSKLAEKKNGSVQGSNHRADKYVGPQLNGEINVHNPNISRNKGCGSRIKSSREISIEEGRDKRRKCSKCDMVAGHNARSCPLNKQ